MQVMAQRPGQDLAHPLARDGSGVQHRGQERLSPLGPMGALAVGTMGPGGGGHHPGCNQSLFPGNRGVDGGPAQRLGSRRWLDGPGRIQEPAPPELRAAGQGGLQHVGLGRGDQDRARGGQHVGYHERGGLARARRAEDEHRLLGAGPYEPAAVRAYVELRAVDRQVGPHLGEADPGYPGSRWRPHCFMLFHSDQWCAKGRWRRRVLSG